MSNPLPDSVDPVRLSDIGQSFVGRLPVSRMGRLVSLLASNEGIVEVQLEFGKNENRVRYIHGQVSTELPAICQRCLEVMTVSINAAISLGLVRSIEEGERLPDGHEPLVLDEETIVLSAIVEDELILAFPVVVLHPEGSCHINYDDKDDDEVVEEEEKPNPFAVLAELKTKQQKKKH